MVNATSSTTEQHPALANRESNYLPADSEKDAICAVFLQALTINNLFTDSIQPKFKEFIATRPEFRQYVVRHQADKIIQILSDFVHFLEPHLNNHLSANIIKPRLEVSERVFEKMLQDIETGSLCSQCPDIAHAIDKAFMESERLEESFRMFPENSKIRTEYSVMENCSKWMPIVLIGSYLLSNGDSFDLNPMFNETTIDTLLAAVKEFFKINIVDGNHKVFATLCPQGMLGIYKYFSVYHDHCPQLWNESRKNQLLELNQTCKLSDDEISLLAQRSKSSKETIIDAVAEMMKGWENFVTGVENKDSL